MRSVTTNDGTTTTEIVAALIAAETTNEAIRNLYRAIKRANANFSLNYICRRAGIPSTGYLSDVMAAKRKLHRKYHDALVAAFELPHPARELLTLMLQRDAGKVDRKDDPELLRQIGVARKNLLARLQAMPSYHHELYFALELFCAFGLFRNRPTLADLVGYYGVAQRDRVVAGLDTLRGMNLITDDPAAAGTYTLTANQVFFNDSDGGLSHLDFLRLALSKAAQDVDEWFPRRDASHFVSSLISVEAARYRALLPEIKNQILSIQSQLEASEADMLVRFNFQLYPATRNPPILLEP